MHRLALANRVEWIEDDQVVCVFEDEKDGASANHRACSGASGRG